MQAKASLMSLARPQLLKSNSVEDIRDFLTLWRDEIDRQWRLLWQDVSTIQVDSDGYIYFGEKTTDGSWRIGRDGADWVLDHRESGTWINASKQKAS